MTPLTPATQDLLQNWLTLERTNEQYYRHLAAVAEQSSRPGARKFFKKSGDDENDHAAKVRSFMIAMGMTPIYAALEACDEFPSSYAAMFQLAMGREQATTLFISNLLTAVDDTVDEFFVSAFVFECEKHWKGFLAEQRDSEMQLFGYLLQIGRLSNDGLEMFDNSLLE